MPSMNDSLSEDQDEGWEEAWEKKRSVGGSFWIEVKRSVWLAPRRWLNFVRSMKFTETRLTVIIIDEMSEAVFLLASPLSNSAIKRNPYGRCHR